MTAPGPGIEINRGVLSEHTVARMRRERAQRKADDLAERQAKELLHRQMVAVWVAGGWPLDADDA